jgi:peptide/nickel transport system substrate-binding protein
MAAGRRGGHDGDARGGGSRRVSRRQFLRGAARGAAVAGLAATRFGLGTAGLRASAAGAPGALTFGMAAEPAILDPDLSGEIPSHNIVRNICETLLVRDKTMNLAPGLAESWRLVNPTTYEFKLRRGVKFHNGEPFNAEAVKFSIERQLTNPKSRAKASISLVDRVEVVDEATARVITKAPFPVFAPRCTYAGTGSVVMLPPRYLAEKGDEYFGTHPVGTGPFRFVDWARGDHVALAANEGYWRGRPAVAQLTFRFIPEIATRVSSLLTGETDIIEAVPPDQVDRIKGNAATAIRMTFNGMITPYFQFNTEMDSPMKNRLVRQAVNYAVDWPTIHKELFRGFARRRPIPLDPRDFGASPSLQYYPYDPAKARKLLAAAGLSSGYSFTMFTCHGRYMLDLEVSQAVAAYLDKVGITAQVQPMEWGVYLNAMAQHHSGPVYIIGWGSGLFDADVLVDEFGCKAAFSTFCGETIDGLLQRARTEVDPGKRRQLYYQAEALLVEEAVFAGAYQPAALFGVNRRVDWEPTIGELTFLGSARVR